MVTILLHDRVAIVYPTIQYVEDISTDNWSQSHGAPVLGQAMNAKGMSNKAGVDSKQHAVCKTSAAREGKKMIRILDSCAQKLGHTEEDCRSTKAPEPAPVQFRDQKITANTA